VDESFFRQRSGGIKNVSNPDLSHLIILNSWELETERGEREEERKREIETMFHRGNLCVLFGHPLVFVST
jgi:hypothetical protein